MDNLAGLIENNFNMMYIPLFDIFGGQERFRLRYKFDNANRYICRREDYPFETLDCGYCLQAMKNSRCVIIEIDWLGSFVFTDHRHSDLFLVLQRYFKEADSFVFCGNDEGGYFKILRDGKIRRKIASFLCMEGIRNCPETRGKPCEYEIASGHVYKADMQARHMKDMLPDFTGREVRALMDYYIDMSRFTDENIRRILIYALSVEEENS